MDPITKFSWCLYVVVTAITYVYIIRDYLDGRRMGWRPKPMEIFFGFMVPLVPVLNMVFLMMVFSEWLNRRARRKLSS